MVILKNTPLPLDVFDGFLEVTKWLLNKEQELMPILLIVFGKWSIFPQRLF